MLRYFLEEEGHNGEVGGGLLLSGAAAACCCGGVGGGCCCGRRLKKVNALFLRASRAKMSSAVFLRRPRFLFTDWLVVGRSGNRDLRLVKGGGGGGTGGVAGGGTTGVLAEALLARSLSLTRE